MIDISDKEKFEYAVSEIKKYLLEFINDKIPILVFGNKSDKALIDITRVKEKINEFATKNPIYFQTSNALSGEGLREGLDWLIKQI